MNKRFFSLLLIIFCLIPIAVHAQETSEIRAVITNIVSEEILLGQKIYCLSKLIVFHDQDMP